MAPRASSALRSPRSGFSRSPQNTGAPRLTHAGVCWDITGRHGGHFREKPKRKLREETPLLPQCQGSFLPALLFMTSKSKDCILFKALLGWLLPLASQKPPCVTTNHHHGNEKQCYKWGIRASIRNDPQCDLSKAGSLWGALRGPSRQRPGHLGMEGGTPPLLVRLE